MKNWSICFYIKTSNQEAENCSEVYPKGIGLTKESLETSSLAVQESQYTHKLEIMDVVMEKYQNWKESKVISEHIII